MIDNKTTVGFAILAVVVVGAAAVAGTYWYMDQNTVPQEDYDSLYNSYTSAQSTISSLRAPLPDVTVNIDSTTFDHTSTVNASDDVAADTFVNHTLTIDNSESTSQTFKILLKYTDSTGTVHTGLPSELQSKYFTMYVYDNGSEAKGYLFNKESKGEFATGWTATIPADTTWTPRTLVTKFDAVDDKFSDGASHDIDVYLTIGGRQVDKLSLTLTT